jgi:hypothetical protein
MMRSFLAVAAGIAGLMGLAAPLAQAGGGVDSVTVQIDPARSSIRLGENIELHVTVTNTGTDPSPPLVLHLDITNPDRSTSVDPEDWTSTLSKQVGVVAPGAARRLDWRIQPISGGSYATYAVAISPGVDNLASSNVAQIDVAEQRALNPGGILIAAVGTPVVVGALLLLQLRRAGRPRRQN